MLKKWLIISMLIIMVSIPLSAANLSELLEMELEEGKYTSELTESGDFNGDGEEDLAALVYLYPEGDTYMDAEYAGIWFVTLEDGKLKKLLEWTDGVATSGGIRGLMAEMYASDNRLYYSASGGSAWIWDTSLAFGSVDGKIEKIGEGDFWGHHFMYGDDYYHNWVDSYVSKSYYRNPIEEDGDDPVYEGSVRYNYFNAQKSDQIQIDGMLDADWEKVNWIEGDFPIYGHEDGKDDLSYQAKALHIGSTLFLYIRVQDDQVVFDDTNHLKQDHVEIWIDSLPTFRVRLDEEKYYDGMSAYRHSRKGLYQFGVYKNGVDQYLPREQREDAIYCQYKVTEEGYDVELAIPLEKYLQSEWSNYGDGIGFSIVVSDTDSKENPRQETLLSNSTLKWGNPYTLGKLYLK